MPEVTIVVPAYNEEENLPLLHDRLCGVMQTLGVDWEWVIVDDHSSDATFAVISAMAERDHRVRGIRLARNHGSHKAITCGLHEAKGDCAIVLAADLQDPPETIPELLEQWRHGAQVVWAARRRRLGEKKSAVIFARVFYFLMRRIVGIREIPATGADFFLVDRRVIDAFCQFKEHNAHIMVLITWMGFRQATITYDKQARIHGRTGWTIEKKIKMALDSMISLTYLPIRVMSYVGFIVALIGFVFAITVVAETLTGNPPKGWASLMVVVLVLGGIQMLMMGVLGEYLWRTLDESRYRPRFLIEATTGQKQESAVSPEFGQVAVGVEKIPSDFEAQGQR